MQVYDVYRAVKVCLGSKMLVGHKPSVPERFALHMKRTRLNAYLELGIIRVEKTKMR